jgi:hypothetical protein
MPTSKVVTGFSQGLFDWCRGLIPLLSTGISARLRDFAGADTLRVVAGRVYAIPPS